MAVKPVYTDPAFDYVIKNSSEPLEIEKAYLYYMKSETPTKSAPLSVTAFDEKGNPIPDAKHQPKSADHPSGR